MPRGRALLLNLAASMFPANYLGDTRYRTNQATSIQVLGPTAASPLANINPVALSLLQLKNPDGRRR
jgi:hypothetical protein